MNSKQRRNDNDKLCQRIDEMPMCPIDRRVAKSRLRVDDWLVNGFCDLLVAIRAQARHLCTGRPIEIHSGAAGSTASKSTFQNTR